MRWGGSRSRALLGVAAMVLSGAACGNSVENTANQLFEARRRWDDSRVKSYSMVVTRGTLVGGAVAVRVTVTQGTVSDRRYLADGQPVPEADANKFPNVEGLFDLAQDAFDRAAAVNATFDGTYGFPTALIIDYVQSKLDDDLTVLVSQFTPAT